MARKRPKQFSIKNVSFSTTDKADYEAWIKGRKLVLLNILQAIQEAGCKLSISTDKYTEACMFSLTFSADHPSIPATVYLIKHADLEKLIKIAGWYFEEVLNRGETPPPDTDDIDW